MAGNPSLYQRLVRPFVVNDVDTADSEWYPDLEPRRYNASREEVLEAARAAIEGRERWRLTQISPDAGRVDAEVETALMGFVDDLTIRLGEGDGTVVVHAHSRSRVGEADLGQNARTIREFFDRLDEQMAANR